MKTRKLFFFAAALFMSANVMTAQAECLRELMPASVDFLDYTHVQGDMNATWSGGVLSGSFTVAQAQWGGQFRTETFAPVVFSNPGEQFVTVSVRVEVGWEGEGTGAGGLGGYVPFRLHIYGTAGSVLQLTPPATLRNGVHYLVWENVAIPPAQLNLNHIRIIMGFSHAGTTFSVSELSICEVEFTPPPPPVWICVENLLEGVQMTTAPTFANPAEAIAWATWNDGVISATMPIATSGPWGLQYRFEFPNIYIDHTQPHGIFMRVEVTGGTFFGNFRLYRGAGGAAAEFNYPGPDALARRTFTPGVHYVELVRDNFTSAFSMINRLLIAGGSFADVSITITEIMFCRMEEDDETTGVAPVERNNMSIHQMDNLIVINSEVEITSVAMYTISGQQVAVTLSGNQIDTSALASGVYLLQVNGTNVFRVIVR